MRFLLNMNVPRQLGQYLTAKGHECRHVGDIGMARASDLTIVEEARSHEEAILTNDLDYGSLLAFSGEHAPSVVIFRLRNTAADNLFARMMSGWLEMERHLLQGAIVMLEDSALRVRSLPVP